MKHIAENDREQLSELQKLDVEVRHEIVKKEITETREECLNAFKLKL